MSWVLAATALVVMGSAAAEQLTDGKLAAELGDARAAEQAFSRVTRDPAVPADVRAEAWVRLAVAQRAQGKRVESAAAFRQAMQSPGRNAPVTRLLALALAGVAPDASRWARQWSKLTLDSSASAGAPPTIRWLGPGPRGVREAIPATDPVTLDLDDVPLNSVLRHLLTGLPARSRSRSPGFEAWPATYRPPAAVQPLGFVIHAGVQEFGSLAGGPRVTVHAAEMPWNELFENLLASHGLDIVRDGNVLFIAREQDLQAFAHVHGRTYAGHPATLDFLEGPVSGLVQLFRGITGFRLVQDADAKGYVTLRLVERPALYALDLALSANDLAAVRIQPPPDADPGTVALRICRRSAPGCEGADLWRLAADTPGERR